MVETGLNILLLSDHFLPHIGGGEFVVHYWATALKQRGHHVIVPTLKPSMRPFKETMKFDYEVDRFPHLPYLPMMSRCLQFNRIHRKTKIDIIHANFLYYAGYVGLRLQKLFGVPCIATAQGADIHVYEGTGYGNVNKPGIRRKTQTVIRELAGLVYTSEKIRQSIVEFGGNPDKMSYVVNGTPSDKIRSDKREIIRRGLGLGPDDLMFLAISRHSPIKGLSLIVEAAKMLKSASINYKIVIAGLKTENILPDIKREGLEKYFEVVGTLPIEVDPETKIPRMPSQAVVDYLSAADVFLAPALSGGFELSTMDAMAAGLAIIISENIGNQDLIQSGTNGFVVANNSPHQIADAMNKLLENPDLARAMGRRNKKEAAKYDWSCIAGQLEEVYGEVIRNWKNKRNSE